MKPNDLTFWLKRVGPEVLEGDLDLYELGCLVWCVGISFRVRLLVRSSIWKPGLPKDVENVFLVWVQGC